MHERWLHGERRALRGWLELGHPADETLTKALAGVEALQAAGALDGAEAARWRDRLERDAAGEDARPVLSGDARAAAEALLVQLRAEGEPAEERFEGALHLLAVAGAADRRAWAPPEWADDAPGASTGTRTEIVAVLPGPPERRLGLRVAFAVRYADAFDVVLDEEGGRDGDGMEWRLTDDAGTRYLPAGGTRFGGAPPPGATWVELAPAGRPEATFRIAL